MRDLGNAGESAVRDWCAIAGITANPSTIDHHGWDLFFELDSGNDIASASGLHESNIECKVQVKATDSSAKTRQIELSNLRAMATTALPAFYLLLEYDGSDRPVAGYLLHIDNAHCEKILKRIRTEVVKTGKNKLNKKMMTLSFKEARKVEPLNGVGLRSAIIDCIGKSQSAYVLRKQKFISQAGFEPGSFSVKFDVSPEDVQRFVEMASGSKTQVEVRDIASFQTRFGVTESFSALSSESALLMITGVVADGKAKVSFINREDGTSLDFDLDVYRGGLGSWVPDKFRMIRLQAQRFTIDISVSTNSCKIWFHKGEGEESNLRELYKNFRFTDLLTKPSMVNIILAVDGRELRGNLTGEGFEGDHNWACMVLKAALDIQGHYESYDDIFTSPAELTTIDKSIVDYASFLSTNEAGLAVEIGFTMSDGAPEISKAECIVPLTIAFGGVMFVSLYVFGGELTAKGGGSYSLKAEWKRCIYKTNFRRSESDYGAEFFSRSIVRAAEGYTSDATVIDLTEKYIQPVAKFLGLDSSAEMEGL